MASEGTQATRLEQHDVVVEKTARYFVLGPEEPIGRIWALHGYGQLPEYFLRRFAPAAEAGWQVVAPEALHRFYVEGTSGRVGASWMTREERAADMADYVKYLDQIYHRIAPLPGSEILLGFSQGVATAARWACRGRARFDAHIFWAGVFPPDLDLAHEIAPLRNVPTTFALGNDDPFFDDRLIATTESAFNAAGIDHQIVRFAGRHAVDGELLCELLASVR
jgi:dienelactone hydrolase